MKTINIFASMGILLFTSILHAESSSVIISTIDDPVMMKALDENKDSAFSLPKIFERIHEEAGLKRPDSSLINSSNQELLKFKESYAHFSLKLTQDIHNLVRDLKIDYEYEILKTYDVNAAKTSEGKIFRKNGNVTRIFDPRWLSSKNGYFTLTGFINRIDRKDFIGGCGEVRLLYRMAYKVKKAQKIFSSRMPFTLNFVFQYPDDGKNCQTIVDLWKDFNNLEHKIFNLGRASFEQLEVNLQAARFPSDLERATGRGFAGQAIYLMRVFGFQNGQLVVKKLENTPDVNGILANGSKAQLKDWIISNLQHIDNGTFVIPETFSTDVALSFSTLGSVREANRPFNKIVSISDANEIISEAKAMGVQLQHINSGEALRDRLNSMSCMGCHQTSSVAGFHFLGKERMDLDGDSIKIPTDGNRLQQGFSPHFYAESFRKDAYFKKINDGLSPHTYRPLPTAPQADWTGNQVSFKKVTNGIACPLGDHLGAKMKWSCEDSTSTCKPISGLKGQTGQMFGHCVPSNKLYSGLACLTQTVESSTNTVESLLGFNLNSFKDKVSQEKAIYPGITEAANASGFSCRPSRIGVPLGRLYRGCRAGEMSLSKVDGNSKEICAIVGGKGFEEMAKGEFDSAKYASKVLRGMLDVCKPGTFCREDYICQAFPDFLASNPRFQISKTNLSKIQSSEIGFCTPTYFVFQMRLDGHPTP